MKIAVIGAGDISGIYLHNMTHVFRNTEVVSCCARHLEHAQAKAEKFGIRAMTLDEILSDPQIELVLVLTGAAEHYSIIRRALLAGKHVYTEKTMTITLEQAKDLVALADEKGLYLGSAPDTFLSPAFQAVKKAIDEGKIGEVTSFQIQATRCIDVLASFALFLREPGGGVCQDYGVYFLTGLVNLLGPVNRVMAVYKNRSTKRINCVPDSPDFGKAYEYRNESQVDAILETESGVTGTFSINGESLIPDLGYFHIYGTKGMISVPNMNEFTGEAIFTPQPENYFSPVEHIVLPCEYPLPDNGRGIGVAEMADAIECGRPNRAGKELAFHVLDTILSMEKSAKSGCFESVASTCETPEAMTKELIAKICR